MWRNSKLCVLFVCFTSITQADKTTELVIDNHDVKITVHVTGHVVKPKLVSLSKDSKLVELFKEVGGVDTWGARNVIYVISISKVISNDDDSLAYTQNSIREVLYDHTGFTLADLKIRSDDVLFVPRRNFSGK